MANNCLVIRLRGTVNDDSLDILEGSVYTAFLETGIVPNKKVLRLGCLGPFDAVITSNATVTEIYTPQGLNSGNLHYEGKHLYCDGATQNANDGFIIESSEPTVSMIVNTGLETLRNYASPNIDITDIGTGVIGITLARGDLRHSPITLEEVPFEQLSMLWGFFINSTGSSGNISEIAKLPNTRDNVNTQLHDLALQENTAITGNLSSLYKFISLGSLDLTRCNITGTVEDFVKAQIQNGRTNCTGDGILIGYWLGNATFTPTSISGGPEEFYLTGAPQVLFKEGSTMIEMGSYSKRLTWTSDGSTATITILGVGREDPAYANCIFTHTNVPLS